MAETFRAEFIRCGKGCGGCPHGPYWYAYQKVAGKLKKRYVGKGDPRWQEEQQQQQAEQDAAREARDRAERDQAEREATRRKAERHPWDDVFDRNTISARLCREILKVSQLADWKAVQAAYRLRSKEAHPDAGGSTRTMQHVNAAYAYLRDFFKHHRG